MKAIEPLIATVLIIAISLAAITVVLTIGKPSIDKSREIMTFEEAQNILEKIDNSIREVASEGEGSTRSLNLAITGGEYTIGENKILFEMDTEYGIVGDGVARQEGNLEIIGESGKVKIELDYVNIDIIGEDEVSVKNFNMIIKNTGYLTKTQVEIKIQ